MKYITVFFATILTILVLFTVLVFSFFPGSTVTEEATTDVDVTAIPTQAYSSDVADLQQQREEIYQLQIGQLDQTIQEHSTTYQQQLQLLNSQTATAQGQLASLQAQEQALLEQIGQLETTRTSRLETYQGQLIELRTQHNTHYAEMQRQLQEAQAKLAEVNAQLGR
jgi:chromosome segregation ATPase